MRGVFLLLPVLVILAFPARPAADQEYDVSKIPPLLRGHASAVVRKDFTLFEVKDERRATLRVTKAVTIYDKSERDYGVLLLWYDKFSEIEDLEGKIYDAKGNEIRELEDGDIKDYSAFRDYSLYEDSRVRIASLYNNTYPYTVEFQYELSYDGFLNWPTWYAQSTMDPIEASRFEVSVSSDQDLRYWCNRDTVKPAVRTEDGRKHYTWSDGLLPELSRDEVGDAEDVTTIVRIAPSSFMISDHPGSMKTWKDLGQWYYNLTVGKGNLPPEEAAEVHRLTDSLADSRSKIKTLYKYLQSRTRYVNVVLGIGGWEPFDASYVSSRRYGDCKALSNYMKALLSEAGITSYPVLVYSGSSRRPLITEFPSNQFNHVIVCVPMKSDSLWLECTSQTVPMGHIGQSTEDRDALMITPQGGVVVRTPASSALDNRQSRRGMVDLSFNGSARIQVTTTLTGDQQDYVRGHLNEASPAERERWILNDLQLQNVSLEHYELRGLETRDPEISLDLNLATMRFAAVSGLRLFFRPNLFERRRSVPPDIPRRLSPVRFSYAYADNDSIYYMIPAYYTAEALPHPVTLTSSFGSFSSSTVALGDTALVFRRRLEVDNRVIPAEHYGEYRKFFSDVVKADRAQVVLVKKLGR